MKRLTMIACACALMFGSMSASAEPVWKHDLTVNSNDSTALISLVPGGQTQSVKLTGMNNIQFFDFGVRSDEIVSEAVVNLDFTVSPSLIANYSQINVYLNDQLQQSLTLDREWLGKPTRRAVVLDVKQLKSINRLSVELIGHYQTICENPANAVLWTTINPSSQLTLSKHKLRLGNDLARFPAPFIDQSVNTLTQLPFVFTKRPSDKIKTAASVLASYGGQVAQWRGIDYPVYFNEVPAEQHFVVFATNENRPTFLKDLPAAMGPEVIIADAPNSRFAKMLIITGRNDEDLLIAVKAFTAPKTVLIGERFKVKQFTEGPARQAYDAPNWIDTQKPIAFAQLMQYPKQLTARAQTMTSVHLPVRLAPDLYMAGGGTLEMMLKYRYSKPMAGDAAQLQVRVNDHLIDSVNLSATEGRGESVIELPPFDGPLASGANAGNALSTVNNFSFDLQYLTNHSEGSNENCKSVTMVSHQMEIEPTSTITLSGLHHYAKLPDLGLFTRSGFPFTKYADLSETVALIPLNATGGELTTLFNTMARLGSVTGATADKVTVTSDVNARNLVHKDILLVGEMPLGLLEFEVDDAKVLQKKVHDHVHLNKLNDKSIREQLQEQLAVTDEGVASLVGLQSPFNPDRTIVALMAEGEKGTDLITKQLRNPATMGNATGGVCVLTENDFPCFEVGANYHVGTIPWYHRIWATVSEYPLILVFCAMLCAALMGYGIFYFMRRWIRGRA